MIDDSELVPRLLESGVIGQEPLREGVALAKSQGASLYETLISNNLVEERDIIDIVASLLKLPSVQLDRMQITPEILQLVPASMAARNRVIPLQVRDERGTRQLVLGMADPIDVLAMDEIATHTGIDIRPVLVGPAELQDFLDNVYNASEPELELIDDLDNLDLDNLDDLAMDVLEDESWAAFFDDAQAIEFEDSAAISQEMRDRPSSDVFEAVAPSIDDVPSLEDLEDFDLNDPSHASADSIASLDEWDIDDAITSRKDAKLKPSPPQKAQILSAYAAKSLFDDEVAGGEASIAHQATHEEEFVEEPTQRKSLEELSASLAEDSDILEDTGRTSIGVGVGLVAEDSAGSMSVGGKRNSKGSAGNTDNLRAEDNQLETSSSGTQAGFGGIGQKKNKRVKRKPGTDYGAVGRSILKSGDEEEDKENESAEQTEQTEQANEANAPGSDAQGNRVQDDINTGVHSAEAGGKKIRERSVPDESGEEEEDSTTGVRGDDADALETGVHKKSDGDSGPKTRDVPDASQEMLISEQNGNVTKLGFLDPKTREIDEIDLFEIPSGHGLNEDTAAAEAEHQQRLLASEISFADDDQHTRSTRSHPSIRHEDLVRSGTAVGKPNIVRTVPKSPVKDVDFDLQLPEGLSERALLIATLKILISRDICDLDTVIALAKKSSEE